MVGSPAGACLTVHATAASVRQEHGPAEDPTTTPLFLARGGGARSPRDLGRGDCGNASSSAPAVPVSGQYDVRYGWRMYSPCFAVLFGPER